MRHPVTGPETGPRTGREARRTLRRIALVGAVALTAWLGAAPARAEYDPRKAGNPLKIVYYVAYPVAFTIDWLILRPAYYIGQVEPFHTVFGTTRHPKPPEVDPAPVPAP